MLATALWNEMSVDEVLGLDLSYAPPFAPVWDPVLIAARKAFEAVEADVRRDVRAAAGDGRHGDGPAAPARVTGPAARVSRGSRPCSRRGRR